ncbi:SDR family NAD(P)-dependent oxidoreductase [Streptomyces sp. SHP 1-2]|uniref:SDR family NAD(P)-dependent oxidoreductase n=1 Tax=Streptomyces sp. SHP 1-2 TaxID=2769489 RepID=UPI002237293D|nr:SDR family NAD(P)-dependent oxidoreductase [Streptomyces sp. SHP 1-2]MCW5253198.1 SDR family NAD(P)-dependent oxidoreductase [Streptomyces sp. SHP 1-2]
MGLLTGKVAIITGGGGGIGKAVAQRYLDEGAKGVCVVDNLSDRVSATVAELGERALGVVADVRSWADNVRVVEQTVERFGGLDVFVGNAGIFDHAVHLADLDGPALESGFDEIMDVNVKGCLLGVRAAMDHLLDARGSVVLTASWAGFHSAGGGVLYTASKHAVVGLIREIAYELAPHVRVNGVAPGVAPTRLRGVESMGQGAKDSLMEGTADALPLKRVPECEDYAGIYAMLASEDANLMTGFVVEADSGLAVRGVARVAGGDHLRGEGAA